MKAGHRAAIVLVVFAAIIVAQRLHTYRAPLECDTALFSVLAKEWRQGRLLYSDVWDCKPPGMICTFAEAQMVAGDGPGSILLISSLTAVLTMIGLFAAVFWLTKDSIAGLWAAAFWTLSNATPYLEAGFPTGEAFVNLCLVWSIAFMSRDWGHAARRKEIFLAGSFLAAATFYKHHIIVLNIVLISCFALAQNHQSSIRKRLETIGLLLIPPIIFWCTVFGYFAWSHRAKLLWDAIVTYGQYYSHAIPGRSGLIFYLYKSLTPSTLRQVSSHGVFYALVPLGIASSLGCALAALNKDRRWIFIMGYVMAAWIGMAIPGMFFPHYYQLLLPPLVISAAVTVALMHENQKSIRTPWLSVAWPAIIATILLLKELPFYYRSADQLSRLVYGEQYFTIKSMGREIGQHLMPEETFYELGFEPGLYYYSGRTPPTGILLAEHWEAGPLSDSFMTRIIQDLDRNKPELLIANRSWISVPGHTQLALVQWSMQHYRPFPKNSVRGPFILYARKNGTLESRLTSP